GHGRDDRDPGFVLLATQADLEAGHQASGEELQDHACAVLTGAADALDGVR
ncbi:MAG: CDP-diacylglycerol diphosphatase, partial [Stenotrophomonas sp.]